MSKVVAFPGHLSRPAQGTFPPPGAAELVIRLNSQLEELRMQMDSVRDQCPEEMWRRMVSSRAYLRAAIMLLSHAFTTESRAAGQADCVHESRHATSVD